MKRPAFTLVEILISAAIFATLTSIVFFNFSNQNRRFSLSQAAAQITTLLQQMLNNAQSGITFQGAVPKGYGITFTTGTSGQFQSYADLDPDGTGPQTANTVYSGSSEFLGTQLLPKYTALYCLSSGNQAYSRLDVLYGTPSGRMVARGYIGASTTPVTISAQVRVVVRDTRLLTCYQVTAVPGIGSLNRQSTTCTCP